MKLERLHEYLVTAVTLLVGMGFAMFAGNLIGQEQLGILNILLFITAVLVVLLLMRREVWLFIPMAWLLYGQTSLLPIPFTVRDIAVLLVFGMYLILVALKQVRAKTTFGLLDVLVWVNVLYVAVAFVRNPVGLYTFNSDMVGGRHYFTVFIAVLAYLILSRVVLTPRSSRTAVVLTVVSAVVVAVLGTVARFRPETVPVLAHIYNGIDVGAYEALDVRVTQSSGRFISYYWLGVFGTLALCARFRPLTLLLPFYGLRFIAFFIVMAATAASGFRSVLIYQIAVFYVASYFRNGMRDIITLSTLGLVALGIMMVGQGRIFDLPGNAQRALSFLPGQWDPAMKAEAESSTNWRVIMWRDAMTTNRYIQDKVFGDGFGFSKIQHARMMALKDVNQSDDDSRESAAIAGDFHSGPISTIRFVGYVGLVLFYVFMGVLFKRAWVMIRRAQGTPYELLALFIGMQVIIEPFYFTFVFGGYQGALPAAIFWVGMMKAIQRALDTQAAETSAVDGEATALTPPLRPLAAPRPVAAAGAGGWQHGGSIPR